MRTKLLAIGAAAVLALCVGSSEAKAQGFGVTVGGGRVQLYFGGGYNYPGYYGHYGNYGGYRGYSPYRNPNYHDPRGGFHWDPSHGWHSYPPRYPNYHDPRGGYHWDPSHGWHSYPPRHNRYPYGYPYNRYPNYHRHSH